MNFSQLKVLAIGAHPDDVEYGCFAVLARCQSPIMVTLTRGEFGGPHNLREAESQATARVLGARLLQLTFEDTNIDLRAASQALEEIVRHEAPDVVLTMTESDLHQDHTITARATAIALREFGGLVLGYPTPSNIATFTPNVFFEVSSDEFDAKSSAIGHHRTQAARTYLSDDAIRALSRFWATTTRTAMHHAEVYQLVKWVDLL